MESLLNMSKAQNRGLTASERTKFDALSLTIQRFRRRSKTSNADRVAESPSSAIFRPLRNGIEFVTNCA